MTVLPKPEVQTLHRCYHGGLDYEEMEYMGIAKEEVIDFSTNCNALGPPAEVKADLSNIAIDRYPDSEATELRRCLAQKMGVLPENILVGNGSIEIIRLIAQAYFGQRYNQKVWK